MSTARRITEWVDDLFAALDRMSALIKRETSLPASAVVGEARFRVFARGLALFGILLAGIDSRWAQLQIMDGAPEIFSVDSVRLTTTPDSGYFLQAAQRYAESGEIGRFESQSFPEALAGYRTNVRPPAWTDYLEPRGGTGLPILLATLSSTFDQSLEDSAAHLLLIGVGLTGLAAFVFFALSGSPVLGLVGAAGAMLSWPVYGRTSAGMVDTDMLNLFFVLAIFSMLHLTSIARSRRSLFAWATLAGVMNFIFFLWYGKAAFAVFFLVVLVLACLFRRHPPKDIGWATLVFLVLSGPEQLLGIPSAVFGFESFYLGATREWITPAMTVIRDNISEARPMTLGDLRFYYGSLTTYVIAVLGALVWTLQDWRRAPYTGVMAVFLTLTFSSGVRFDHYVAPMLWVGYAAIVTGCCVQLLRRLQARLALLPRSRHSVIALLVASALITLGLADAKPTRGMMAPPDVPAKQLAMLKTALANRPPGVEPVIVTDWGLGYFVGYHTRMPTIHDGGTMISLKTTYFARAMLQTDPESAARDLRAATYFDEWSLRRWYPELPPEKETFGTDRELWLFIPTRMRLALNSTAQVAALMDDTPPTDPSQKAKVLAEDPNALLRALYDSKVERWGEFEKIAEEPNGAKLYRLPSRASPTRRHGSS